MVSSPWLRLPGFPAYLPAFPPHPHEGTRSTGGPWNVLFPPRPPGPCPGHRALLVRCPAPHADRSLVLLKATGQVPHAGLTRFSKGSWAYQVMRAWIAQGARWTKGSGDVRSVRIDPPEQAFTAPGQSAQLRVRATFADGTSEDITPLCDFRTNDDAVAEVTSLGKVKAVRPGDTSVIVSYRGQ